MTTDKLVWMLIPLTLSVIGGVLGFKSYIISSKNEIRRKYDRFLGQSGVEWMIQKEYEQQVRLAIILFVVFATLSGALAYFVGLCLKNDIPLI